MPEGYYERESIVHLDGSPVFQNALDRAIEDEVADYVAKKGSEKHGEAGKLSVVRFAPLCPIDWYAERYDRMVGLLERKSPREPMGAHKNVLLNVRKWLALTMGATGLGVPAIFVVRWNDGNVRWLPLSRIDASKHRIGGCKRIVKSAADIEPVIEVPVDSMRVL